jgi:tagatose 6-phosphate kinase
LITCLNLNATEDLVYECAGLRAGGVNRARALTRYPGGKGANVARTLALLGARPKLVAFAPRNGAGWDKTYFESRGVACDFIPVPGTARPCLILHDASANRETVVNSPSLLKTSPAHWAKIKQALKKTIRPGDLACVSGTLPSGTSGLVMKDLLAWLHGLGAVVLFDSSGEAFRQGLRAGPFLVKPNLEELEELQGRKITTEAGVRKALSGLLSGGVKLAVASLGSQGCLAAVKGGFYRVKALAPLRGPHSPVGCGDAFMAGLAYGLDKGFRLEDSLAWATACGWANLHHPGASQMAGKEVVGAFRKVHVQFEGRP